MWTSNSERVSVTGNYADTAQDWIRRMRNMSCRSSNLIYSMTCKICKMQYIGQTMLRIKDRFAVHFHDIMTNDLSHKALGRPFSMQDHNCTKDMEISVVEFIHNNSESLCNVAWSKVLYSGQGHSCIVSRLYKNFQQVYI